MNWLKELQSQTAHKESIKGSFQLQYNPHAPYYQSTSDYLENNGHLNIKFLSDEDRELILQQDQLWELTWYPNTPVCFYTLMASSLDKMEELFQKEFGNKKR